MSPVEFKYELLNIKMSTTEYIYELLNVSESLSINVNRNRIVIDSDLSRVSIDNSTILLLNIKQAVYECVLNT